MLHAWPHTAKRLPSATPVALLFPSGSLSILIMCTPSVLIHSSAQDPHNVGDSPRGAFPAFSGSSSLKTHSCFTIAWTVASRQILLRKQPDVTRTALRLVVDLIQIAPAVFASRCLPDCVQMLSDMLRDQRCKLRAEAFVTHAAIVHSLGAVYVRPHVAVLLASLREALIRGTRSRLFCPEALASLTALAHSFGEEVALQLQPLIKPILGLPLSPALLQALHALTTFIPSLARSLRTSVLNILTYVLSRRTWRCASKGIEARLTTFPVAHPKFTRARPRAHPIPQRSDAKQWRWRSRQL